MKPAFAKPFILIGLLALCFSNAEVQRLGIRVRTIEVSATVVVGHHYQLEGSTDLQNWNIIGAPYIATHSEYIRDVDVQGYPLFFRLLDVTPDYAPATLAELLFVLNSNQGQRSIRFFSNSDYEFASTDGTIERGTYETLSTKNLYTVVLTPTANPSIHRTIQLAYTGPGNGNYTATSVTGENETGTFAAWPIIREIEPLLAPATLSGKSYSLTYEGITSTLIFPDDVFYEWNHTPERPERGHYVSTLDGETWVVFVRASNSSGPKRIRLSFTQTAGGIVLILDENGTERFGTFGPSGDPCHEFAPPSLDGRIIQFTHSTGPYQGTVYSQVFLGQTTGTFTTFNWAEGNGNFTYTVSPSSVSLFLEYIFPLGEFDDFTLHFSSALNGTFSGSTKNQDLLYNVTGTFLFEN